MTENKKVCVVCKKTSEDVPLFKFKFKGNKYRICPEHLPTLIHNPHDLADLIPGTENLNKVENC